MSAVIAVGRVLFAILFVVSGVLHLFNVAETSAAIAAKVAIPAAAADYAAQLEGASGMPVAQLLAIAAGAVELIGGLAIAFNLGTRFFAGLLILLTAAATFYFHDFWNGAWPDSRAAMIQALNNLSLIGGLVMIAGIGGAPRPALPAEAGSHTY